jgi:hypothetical protein
MDLACVKKARLKFIVETTSFNSLLITGAKKIISEQTDGTNSRYKYS